jgi:nucleotide-binding universal stress UspA family protein
MNGPIVVGTDGSDTATLALDAAITFAKSFGQPLHIVSAYKPLNVSSGLPPEFDGCITSTTEVDAVMADALSRAKTAGVEAHGHSESGSAAEALLGVAERVSADVIVVGNRGIRSKARYVLGNVPSKVVHNATCSTFVVQTT